MWNAGLDEAQTGIKIARRNINNLRYEQLNWTDWKHPRIVWNGKMISKAFFTANMEKWVLAVKIF